MAKENVELLQPEGKDERPVCGLIMPISAIDDCSESHWAAVEGILTESINDAGLLAKLVSQESVSGVIHQRIITNLYTNSIVVCDVSGRNPNVMFELGMRLAFDKPTIIVKDDVTPFSFDIGAVEHIQYPRSLRYAEIIEFKSRLSQAILSTIEAAKDPNYSTFLKNFTGLAPARIEVKEVSAQEYLSSQLEQVLNKLDRIERPRAVARAEVKNITYTYEFGGPGLERVDNLATELLDLPSVLSVGVGRPSTTKTVMTLTVVARSPDVAITRTVEEFAARNDLMILGGSRS